MKRYPFTRCLEPRAIRNPYTKQPLVVGCGKCEACLNDKANNMTLKCELEALSSIYHYFVTLTYANEFIPILKPYKLTNGSWCFVDVTERTYLRNYRIIKETINYGEIMVESDISDSEVNRLIHKCKLPNNCIPYLNKRDAQLFLKRLRKLIKNQSNESIRYYCCGEYGPVHFRPHLHFLLSFNEQQTAENLRENISKAWRFGRVDVSQSRGSCSSYVSSYVNSYVSVPKILKTKSVAPFQLHSTFFGEEILRRKREEVYEASASEFNKRSIQLNGSVAEFCPWRSFKHYYFPKCRNYDFLTHEQRVISYTYYSKLSVEERVLKISELSKIILDELNIPFGQRKSKYLYIYEQCNLIDYYGILSKITYEQAFLRVYSFLRVSQHFHKFVCAGNRSSADYYVRKIEQYYKDSDFDALTSQLTSEEEYGNEFNCECEEDYFNFFANRFNYSKLLETSVYKDFFNTQKQICSNRIKHKELNDLNKIFLN